MEKHTQNKEEKGGQNTNPPKGVEVDKLLTLQHIFIFLYIYIYGYSLFWGPIVYGGFGCFFDTPSFRGV